MDGYIQTGIGIFVSLILFVIGYRQTIGAKKERAKNANNSIHRAIMRRMVLEDYAPAFEDISRIIEGKAREFHVSPNDLRSEEQVMNSLYTEVFDSDLNYEGQVLKLELRSAYEGSHNQCMSTDARYTRAGYANRYAASLIQQINMLQI